MWIEIAAFVVGGVSLIVSWTCLHRARAAMSRMRMVREELMQIRESPIAKVLLSSEAYRMYPDPHDYYVYRRRMSDISRFFDVPETTRRRLADTKKTSFQQMGPRSFYYIDEAQVRDLYDQVSEELEPQRIETEERSKTEAGLGARLRFLNTHLGGEKETRTKRTFEVKLSPAVMYTKVEAYLIHKGMVTFGLEDFDFDESTTQTFAAMCKLMNEQFSFKIPDDLQAKFIKERMRQAAFERVKAVSLASGLVAIQGEFLVKVVTGTSRILSLTHPLNGVLEESDRGARIDITCDDIGLSPSGKNTLPSNATVKVSCLGKVIRWDAEANVLAVTPVAVF